MSPQRQRFNVVTTTKGCWEPLEAGEARNELSPRASRRSSDLSTPSFWSSDTDIGLLASRRMREHIFVFSSYNIHGNLLPQQP